MNILSMNKKPSNLLKEMDLWEAVGYIAFGPLEKYKYSEIVDAIEQSGIKNKTYALRIINILYGERLAENESIVEKIEIGRDKYKSEKGGALSINEAVSGLEYLADEATPYWRKNIYGAVRVHEIDDEKVLLPVAPTDKISFGVVYPWPGMETAETELLYRMKKAADNIGFKCEWLSDFGEALDDTQHTTDVIVDGEELDFVMTTHYESNKTVDTYYYHLLWNPPDIPLNTRYYEGKVLDNYLMNDDYLIYDFGGMSNHLRSMLINKPRNIDNASTFVGSFPKSSVLSPCLDNPKIFYCGMNWEKAMGENNRHEGLFKLLDKTGKVKFYGPEFVESWGGIRPWEGYDCYQYSITFDGFSIIKEINSCGICLAISSDAHRRAGAVTNRAYEACAAGAVIISDNNVFMEEYFGDSVLYITYNKNNPKDTFNQIMEKYQWIVENKEQAIEMARKSQKIFVEKFCMEKGFVDVAKNHFSRFKTIEKDLFAKDDTQTVLVTYVLNTLNREEVSELLDKIVENIEHQYYRSIVLGVICDSSIRDDVEKYLEKSSCNAEIIEVVLFDEKGARALTDAQAIRVAQNSVEHTYYINTKENEKWFYDHVTTLVRTAEDDDNCVGSYSGLLSEDNKQIRRAYMFNSISYNTIYYPTHLNNMPVAGQYLFKANYEDTLKEYMLGCVDGLEHVAYAALLVMRGKKPISFSKRMTCTFLYEKKIKEYSVLDYERQLHFIRGLVRYDIQSGMLTQNDGIEFVRGRKDFLLMMPLTQSISVRFWRKIYARMRKVPGINKLLEHRYKKKLEKYYSIMDALQER